MIGCDGNIYIDFNRRKVVSMNRWDEVLNVKKLQELLGKEEEEEKKSSPVCLVLGVVLVVTVIAAIAYAAYRYFTPDYLEDFEDDFEDDFDDDFFDDEEESSASGQEKDTADESGSEDKPEE